MSDLIQQIKSFPIPEIIHSLQGWICGALAAHGVFKNQNSFVMAAILVAICFIAYESLEQLRIRDKGDVDVMVFAGTALFTGIIYSIIHFWRKKHVQN